MCETCGCSGEEGGYKIYKPGEKPVENVHEHTHNQEQTHSHGNHTHTHDGHTHTHTKQTINVEQNILEANDKLAERNRGYFDAKEILALNLVSSPGSGKTSILEKTIKALGNKIKCYVIEGDQQTDNDAKRIAVTGAEVLQINTGNACHLDSNMVHEALHQLKPQEKSIIFIENVGNLVCPALFDLGESSRVVIFSTTEGEDKPLKYPNMFHSSNICLINKVDLLPYLDFNIELAKQNVLKVNPSIKIIELSAKTGDGMNEWLELLKK
jgi:hydrogenase nickel incorporation protein HypB